MPISSIRFSHLGHTIQRQATTTHKGEGVTKRSVDLTRANGNEISRELTVTRVNGEATKVDGSVTTGRGTTNYNGTVDKGLQTAEITITGANGNARTVTLHRQTGYDPRPISEKPGSPVTLEPVNPGAVMAKVPEKLFPTDFPPVDQLA